MRKSQSKNTCLYGRCMFEKGQDRRDTNEIRKALRIKFTEEQIANIKCLNRQECDLFYTSR